MSRTDVTVLMPLHEGRRFLAETLRSVACEARRRPDIALRIDAIDSGADGSHGIVRDFAASAPPNLSVAAEHRADLGPWTTKTNAMAARASSPWLSLLHQDDLWLAGRLDRLWPHADDPKATSAIVGPVEIVDACARPLGTWRPAEGPHALFVQNTLSVPGPLVSRAAWNRVGGMDEALWYTADWDLWLKLARDTPFRRIAEPTAAFRIHPDSQTVQGARDGNAFAEQMRIVVDRHMGAVPEAERTRVRRAAEAAIEVNGALAFAARGGEGTRIGERLGALGHAVRSLTRLGVLRWPGFLRDTALVERVRPRLRARAAGRL